MRSTRSVVLRPMGMRGLVFAMTALFVAAEDGLEGAEIEPAIAVLFPWFAEALGVMIFFLTTRYYDKIPYTAILFLLGMFMGIGVSRLENRSQLSETIYQWANIDWHVLLLVFLPGLVFKDSFGMNVHLFQTTFSQVLVFAFPMVLAGACLTALVAFYIFPYNWSWNLAMTFGSILSATDPVAVSALLEEVGAPPRLAMHISGESLLNDGSAMTFYLIFSALFLAELGIPGLGEDLNVGDGFAMFFRAALGGMAIGIAFGLGLILLLFLLNRRLNGEENVVQVASTITIAYLAYYVGDVVCDTSGVIAVVFCGVTANAFGSAMINNQELMDSFWALVEHLLNTALFVLGGVVWGNIISNGDLRDGDFKAKDWGYLILLYVLLNVIRFVLIFGFYPITVNIGISTNWQESFFSAFGGLRGAVGISLALSLDSQVRAATGDPVFRTFTNTLFGMVGGIALFTLVINGTFSAPVLKKLGLATPEEVRTKLVDSYNGHLRQQFVDIAIRLLTDPRYHRVDYKICSDHLPFFKELTVDEFKAGLKRYNDSLPSRDVESEPYVPNILAYLEAKDGSSDAVVDNSWKEEKAWSWVEKVFRENMEESSPNDTAASHGSNTKTSGEIADDDNIEEGDVAVPAVSTPISEETPGMVKELRKTFIELLRSAYEIQVEDGELDGRTGFIDFVLFQSLDYAMDAVSLGKPLNDWEMAEKVNNMWIDRWIDRGDRSLRSWLSWCGRSCTHRFKTGDDEKLGAEVLQALAFMEAHLVANNRFKKEFSFPKYGAEKKQVLDESRAQVLLAVQVLQSFDQKKVETVVSHILCTAALNKASKVIEAANTAGVLKDKEANGYLEHFGELLDQVHECTSDHHCHG